MTLALLPSVVGVFVVGLLLWPALAELAVDLMQWVRLTVDMRWGRLYRPRHSVHLIVKNWRREEAAYQAALDKVWIGAIAEMAARGSCRR